MHEAGSGEPLVLIHGLATTQGIWSMVTPALACERRVVTLDVPGLIENYLIWCRDWGSAAGEVACDVHLWHGLNDPLVPVEHPFKLALTLPRCRAFIDPDNAISSSVAGCRSSRRSLKVTSTEEPASAPR